MTTREDATQPAESEKVLRFAMDFPIDHIVQRYSRDHDVPLPLAHRHAQEIKRFLLLCAFQPKKHYGMRGQIDQFWHTFMFYSREYFDFCFGVSGGYIHHSPESPTVSPEDAASSARSYLLTLSDYETTFGQSAPEDIWPRLNFSSEKSEACGNSCRSCGNGCSSCGHGCTGCTRCGS